MNKIIFPKGYEPYPELEVCSNVLKGGTQILMVDNELPIIVGKGQSGAPSVWMKVPTGKKAKKIKKAKKLKLFVEVVRASESVHPAVNVIRSGSSLIVSAGGVNVLQVVEQGKNRAAVVFLDLRNVGYDIHGNKTFLSAGGGTFRNNTMSGGMALIAFGK